MKLCRVVGKGDAAVKQQGLDGRKLLVVQEIDGTAVAAGPLILAVDTQGAGVGEVVAVVTGSAAIRSVAKGDVPYDAAIVAIMEHLHINGRQVYNRNQEA
jgi:ethanolamine utilization protein EutN